MSASRKKTAKPTWGQYFRGFAQNIGLVGPNLAKAGVEVGGHLAAGNLIGGAGAAASHALSMKDKHYQLKQLVSEVNDALYYIQEVKRWLKETRGICNKGAIEEVLKEVDTYVQSNYVSTNGFFHKLKEADKRAMEALRHIRTDPEGTQAKIADFLSKASNEAFIGMWPDYYRQDLGFHMIRLIEVVKAAMMQKMLSDEGCPLKRNVLKLSKEPEEWRSLRSSRSAAAAGGRSRRSRSRK